MFQKVLFFLAAFLPFNIITAATPESALQQLIQGNQRYMQDQLSHPNRSAERREALLNTQFPFATIVGCSDSRVSPEIVFDQGVGDLFVVRVAGNVVGPIELASINYSIDALGSSLILVLGHENCGAVKAVLAQKTANIEPIASKIEAALKEPLKFSENPLENAIKLNVYAVVKQLRTNALLSTWIDQKKLQVVGGYYNLSSGKVEICCGLP